ncbi:hypothetical protein M3Y97_00649400 [Aphelenchoides bicaudatus]|nr:hypothetical protein M3Y97_00649400 [Aphelenchoides bicaudatus]
MNIITALAQAPLYSIHWPNAFNYGAFGSIIGHEIGHAFDNNGVFYDEIGNPNEILDNASKSAFNKTVQCIIDEYNQIHLGKKHVDGKLTQSENIPDNSGIQAAYHAYKAYNNLHGWDPLLPGRIAGQFTDDQCMNNTLLQTNPLLWKDLHSPDPARTFGTLQNFKAFRSAFNCPINFPYAPQKTCNIWITDAKPNVDNPPAN